MSGPAAAAPKNPDTYTYLTISDADSLDPAWGYDTFSEEVVLNLYEPLFFFETPSTEKLTPLIAARVPSRANGLISADGRTYRIPLRKNIRFHDGSLLTPEDVRYSLVRFMLYDRDAGPSWLLLEPLLGYHSTREEGGKPKPRAYADAMKAVRLEGDTLVLRLPKPYAPLLSILASWAPIVSKPWMIAHHDWDGTEATWTRFNNPKKEDSPLYARVNGTGPFKLERWDRGNKEFTLRRHDRYWREPARLARVVIKGVEDLNARRLMLAAGDADSIYATEPDRRQLRDLPGVRFIDELPMMEMNPIAFFTFKANPVGNPNIGSGRLDGNGVPPDFFSDLDVRKGFAYAFDYPGYIRDVFRGHARRATGLVPETLPGHNPDGKAYPFDPAKAAEHLKRAWGGRAWERGFRFTLTYNVGNPFRQSAALILKKQVESLNPKFRVEIRPVEWPTFLDHYQAGKLPIFILGWNADFPDAHSFAYPLMHSAGDYPRIQGYKNAEADRLVEAAVGEADPAKRRKLYFRLQEIEYEDVPHLVFEDTRRFRTERTWLHGFVHNPILPDAPYGCYFYPLWKE